MADDQNLYSENEWDFTSGTALLSSIVRMGWLTEQVWVLCIRNMHEDILKYI